MRATVDDSPVFVTGLPRTGKTPLRIALGSHPALSMTRKTRMWTNHFGLYGDLSSRAALDSCLAAMLDDPNVARLLPDEAMIRREFSRRQPTYANLFGVFHSIYAQSNGKPRWGEQMAGLEFFADPILESWPNAVFIHMVRDPSAWIDPGSRLRPGQVGAELATWLESARKAIANRQRYGRNYLIISFEDMLTEPAGVLREIGGFIDEELNFGIGDLLVKALPEPGAATGLRGPARRYVDVRTRSVLAELGYPPPDSTNGRGGVWDLAAERWFEMGRGLETAREAS